MFTRRWTGNKRICKALLQILAGWEEKEAGRGERSPRQAEFHFVLIEFFEGKSQRYQLLFCAKVVISCDVYERLSVCSIYLD